MENQCKMIEYYLMNLNKNPELIYTIVITTINTYFWIKQEKPNKTKIILSYLLSLGSRYMFFPIYIIGDTICYISNFTEYINKNNLRIL